MDPFTLLLLGAGALFLAGKKKKTKPVEPEHPVEPACPVGYYWDPGQRRCVAAADGPPQIEVLGLCESWRLLPDWATWWAAYGLPAMAEMIGAIGAQPQQQEPTFLYGQQETMPPEMVAHVLISNSPLAYATEQIQTLGQLCKLPYSEEWGPNYEPGQPVPEAMVQLQDQVQATVEQLAMIFNTSGQLQFPEEGS